MLAWLQKAIALGLSFTAIAWAAYFLAEGHAVWAVAGALLILLGYAFFLGVEFTLLYWIQRPGPVEPAGPAELFHAWCGEVVIAPQVFLWRQPFRSKAERDFIPAKATGQRGVVLVHGFVCNRGFWNPWMRELRRSDIPFLALNLEPLFGSIEHYADLIESTVARMEKAGAGPVVLVGHSMGGVAIRVWLSKFNADERVLRIVTIGSPHQGTWLARYGHTVNGKEMRLDNPWLARIAATEHASRCAKFTCFYGRCDNIVFPAASGTMPGAVNVHVPGTAHVHMAFRAQVFREVRFWLSTPALPVTERAAVQ